nr:integrase, catalytic region, zinc finger, CCHC-type, peptidase aspartic, catalytic [Tanacetum cinerariifolium]GFA03136.1 integrase, catalytic region, zinc finger, CCHC-type, peptidase aspartic, catalytic [Tanacetum cinerariifolium]
MVSLKGDENNALFKPVTSNSAPSTRESTVVKNNKVIAPRMFRINPLTTSKEENHVPNKPLKSSTTLLRPQDHNLGENTKNDRVHSASKSNGMKNKEVDIEEHHRNLLLSKNKRHISSECKNIKLAIQNDKSKVVCPMLGKYSNYKGVFNEGLGHNQFSVRKFCDSNLETRRPQPRSNTKNDRVPSASKSSRSQNKEAKVEEHHRKLLLSKNNKHISSACNNIKIDSHDEPKIKRFPNSTSLLDRNDHVAAILGFCDLQWVNILITRVYFVEGLGHNLFSVGQFCYSNLEVAFRRNACFVKNLEGVDLLKRDRSTNLYNINLHEMASASPICLMARTSSTKSWLWHQRLSYLNFNTINNLARNDLVAGLPKFKYHKEHLCPSLLCAIPRMIVKILGNLVQKVILDSSLGILLIPVLTEFTIVGQRK